jgi:hypothetical protein
VGPQSGLRKNGLLLLLLLILLLFLLFLLLLLLPEFLNVTYVTYGVCVKFAGL